MTVHQALKEAADALGGAGVPDSRLDAEYLLSSVLNTSRMALMLNGCRELSPHEKAAFDALLARRRGREPLQYILSAQSFLGFELYVDENVLIPRPETELLCEQALLWLGGQHKQSPEILDLCTGSGALAIAIARMLPGAQVSASDISPKALDVARKNAKAQNAKIAFYEGDFLSASAGHTFDCIVCNPPYIPSKACDSLQAEVLREPRSALDGGEDGLMFYRRLAMEAPISLRPGGALFCEVGYNQAEAVKYLLASAFEKTEVFHDLSKIPRIVLAISPKTLSGGTHVR